MKRSRPTTIIARNRSAGFSLVELVIVCGIASILAAIALASFANRDQATRFQADVAARIRERRASAVRINALTEATLLENFRQPSIGIDFATVQTTAALVVEGEADRTTFQPPATAGTQGTWNFVYQGREVQIPTGWRIANSASQLSPLPLIPLGVPTTSFSFASDGRLDVASLPPASSTNPNAESPFPTIYLTNGNAGRAVAVHPSGLLELWQYDERNGRWNGFSNRTVTNTPTPAPLPSPTATPTIPPCSISVSPNPLSIANNSSAVVTVTLSSYTSTDTILAAASGAARITVSPSAQQVTGQQSVQFTVNVMTNNGSVNFSSPCGSNNLSIKTF
jgi:prepilin-type N-terminal cleavage/methylation domain-containing protein